MWSSFATWTLIAGKSGSKNYASQHRTHEGVLKHTHVVGTAPLNIPQMVHRQFSCSTRGLTPCSERSEYIQVVYKRR